MNRNSAYFLLGIIFVLSGCSADETAKVKQQLSELKSRFAPDTRTEIWNIHTEKRTGAILLKGETTSTVLKSELAIISGKERIIDSITYLPDTSQVYHGLATLSVINIRKEPDHAAEMVSQSIMGTPLLILKRDNPWMLVKTPDGYIGWAEKYSVAGKTAEEVETWKRSGKLVYTCPSGWIYSDAGHSGIVSDIVEGSIIRESGREKDEVKIELPDGRQGYVSIKDVKPYDEFINASHTEADVISQAEKLIGIPYLWGGSSSKGADCSGLVQTVYFMNGLILQRDASMQAKQGVEIDISSGITNLKPGDLLFFGKPDRITHVAIYKGNGEYIHSSGRVMINSLLEESGNFNSYRKNSLVKAMRVFGTDDNGIIRIKDHSWY
ncbi:MAG TPA: C40 family peptidase [Bacteroidales bacterium]|nr:C40 family peptidase [Bacteroidales bacterium]